MFYQLKDRLNRLRFAAQCGDIYKTPPLRLDAKSPLTVLSQLQHKDLLLYLWAVKSFALRLPIGQVLVVNDGTLTRGDRETLQRHIPGVRLIEINNIHTSPCPRGGTWERLLSIADSVGDRYIIQLDSDTLALSTLPEIENCISEGRSFVIGTWDRQEFEPMVERQKRAMAEVAKGNHHVQVMAESNFDKLSGFTDMKYVRGCSGFSGFAPGSFTRGFVEDISRQMESALGKKWHEWGSEQVMSNIVVANSPQAAVLPHPKYADCTKMRPSETVFVHFIGTCRFKNGYYEQLARAMSRTIHSGSKA